MCSVGSGMVLAIGDLAGATFVTLLAATATQFARAGRLWTLCTIEIELPCGWAGISGGKITARQSDWATIEIDGVQHIVHRRPAPANFVLPWRRRAP